MGAGIHQAGLSASTRPGSTGPWIQAAFGRTMVDEATWNLTFWSSLQHGALSNHRDPDPFSTFSARHACAGWRDVL